LKFESLGNVIVDYKANGRTVNVHVICVSCVEAGLHWHWLQVWQPQPEGLRVIF